MQFHELTVLVFPTQYLFRNLSFFSEQISIFRGSLTETSNCKPSLHKHVYFVYLFHPFLLCSFSFYLLNFLPFLLRLFYFFSFPDWNKDRKDKTSPHDKPDEKSLSSSTKDVAVVYFVNFTTFNEMLKISLL